MRESKKETKKNNKKKTEETKKEIKKENLTVEKSDSELQNQKEKTTAEKLDSKIQIDEEKLDKIGEEINKNKQNSKSTEKRNIHYKSIFKNIIIAIVYIIYFILILLGKNKIPTIEFIRDIKFFIILDLIASVILYEKSFKKDSTELFIYGIETSFLGGFTICILDWFGKQNPSINLYISIIIGAIVGYSVIKSIYMVKKNNNLD